MKIYELKGVIMILRKVRLEIPVLPDLKSIARKDLKAIYVKKLFNRFNYNIDLEQNDKVSVIIAPNGCGKSTIFRLINLIFNPSLNELITISKIPFESIACEFNDGIRIKLRKLDAFSDKMLQTLESQSDRNRTDLCDDDIFKTSIVLEKIKIINKKETIVDSIDITDVALHVADRLSYFRNWNLNRDLLKFVSSKDDDSPYIDSGTERLLEMDTAFHHQIVIYLSKWSVWVNTDYIQANRLQRNVFTRRYNDNLDVSTFDIVNYQMQQIHSEALREYNKLLSDAKNKLPEEFIQYKDIKGSEKKEKYGKELIEKWNEYKLKLQNFTDLGLLSEKTDFFVDEQKDIEEIINKNPRNTQFMSVYINLFLPTLTPLNDVYQKLSLLKQIFDERNELTGKRLIYSTNGFSIQIDHPSSEQILPLDYLSSGEKHDLVMFFDIIFQSSNKGLFLIDEPEISLHIEWQETYLDYLCDICRLNNCLAVVATHSPNILNDHEALLRGLNNETA